MSFQEYFKLAIPIISTMATMEDNETIETVKINKEVYRCYGCISILYNNYTKFCIDENCFYKQAILNATKNFILYDKLYFEVEDSYLDNASANIKHIILQILINKNDIKLKNKHKLMVDKCANCCIEKSFDVKLKRCSRCNVVVYCSEECQENDWNKKICKIMYRCLSIIN